MMRKANLVILVGVALAVFLVGCFPMPQKKEAPSPENESGYVETTPQVEEESSSSTTNAVDVVMDRALNRKVNIFLSNFAECFMDGFTRQSITDLELVRFGVGHNYKNNFKLWQPTADKMNVKIKADYVTKTIDKYFGPIGFSHQSADEWTIYRDGHYIVPVADGEAIPFVQIDRLTRDGNGLYTAYGSIYGNANYLMVDDPYKPLSAWSNAERAEIEYYGKIQATFTEVTESDKSRFIIQSYTPGN
jgi:hypothetical protein